jgi:hydrogenase nickel incorporation protein HypA/HybF
MHELAVTENILEIITRHAQEARAKRVTDIHLVIGSLASIVDDSVQFYWDILSKETICEGAVLHFNRVEAVIHCMDCGNSYTIQNGLTPCLKCGSIRTKVIAGDEFKVDSFDIETEEEQE